jgi:DNA processing protein
VLALPIEKNPFIKSSITSSYSQEVIDILRLARSENIGPRTFYSLIQIYGSASNALEYIKDLSLKGGKKKPIRILSEKESHIEIKRLDRIGARILTYQDADYPQMLKTTYDKPPIITYLGNKDLFQTKSCAIVGARNASLNGKNFAGTISRNLVENNITIVSGLARGVDSAAHMAALPNTIAVIAGGIDHIYPKENTELYHQIADQGAIIAENPIGSNVTQGSFPQRNRIIAGIASSTLVVEAGIKSGSLITARFALEQGRDVCAVPGFPLDPRCEGSNRLIKEGAYLVESYHDVLDLYQNEYRIYGVRENNKDYTINPKEIDYNFVNASSRNSVISLLSSTSIDLDSLQKHTELPLPAIYTILLELELAGEIIRYPGNKFALLY